MSEPHFTEMVMRLCRLLLSWMLFTIGLPTAAWSMESLVIAASPGLAAPLEALGRAFEASHTNVKVRLYFASGLDLRRTIAAMENHPTGQYFIGTGPIHIVAPGGDEVITRLAQKYYVLPESRRPYATVSLVLVVPESLVDAPNSFEALAQDSLIRVAVADPKLTVVGEKTQELFKALGMAEALKDRLDIATDARAVFDHVLQGQADVGIMFGPDAYVQRERVRVVAIAPEQAVRPVVHSLAMERYCPNRPLCEEFLAFSQSQEAQNILIGLGYGLPGPGQ
ncbi:MAG: molybdate ABC transporter substrate-binding protein [Nitrospirota bacterium]|nr:molybdate ABC transporter substrate-binding protein [Nitrospirota bacterium]MDP2383593.1 molybdate ABC transporter substrate-binding protein [Nitrospirota bacterium]MDP3599262.1 molybdate ABC transporter substrate-binding protein [Nitrospirota bacterium]